MEQADPIDYLKLKIDDEGFIVTPNDEFKVADTHCSDPLQVDIGVMDAWAERIVAAVNACSGISAHDLTRFPPGTIAAILPKLKGQGQRIKDLEAALTACATSLRDLHNDWPERELHEPIQMSLDRVERLIPGWDE